LYGSKPDKAGKLVSSALVVLDLAQDASEGAELLYKSVGFTELASSPRRMILAMESIAKSLR
jgi:hypothetical protein